MCGGEWWESVACRRRWLASLWWWRRESARADSNCWQSVRVNTSLHYGLQDKEQPFNIHPLWSPHLPAHFTLWMLTKDNYGVHYRRNGFFWGLCNKVTESARFVRKEAREFVQCKSEIGNLWLSNHMRLFGPSFVAHGLFRDSGL